MDKKFAPLAVEWEAGERSLAVARIRQLRAVVDVLKTGKRITNPVLGITPDVVLSFVNPGSRQARANAERIIQEGTRAVLGAQYTQKEGDSVLARSYDISAPQTDNIARLESVIERMENAARDRQAMLDYMRGPGNGSLMGYKGRVPTGLLFDDEVNEKPPASGQSGAPATSPRVEGVPRGVDPAEWNVMTPKERALWRK